MRYARKKRPRVPGGAVARARAVGLALAWGLLVPLAACETVPEEPVDAEASRALSAACVPAQVDAPEGAWICGEDRVEECDAVVGSHPGTIWVVSTAIGADPDVLCVDDALRVENSGPYGLGEHTVVVRLDAAVGDRTVCESALVVRDTRAPRVTTRAVDLWPPNHRMTTVTPADCLTVVDRCDPSVDVLFTWVTSDEPADAVGDGATAPDVTLAADAVSLRVERQGGGDGRVYTIGWLAVDDAGNAVEGTCRVAVPHDQGGGAVAVDSGPATLVALDRPVVAGPYEVHVDATGLAAAVRLERPE